MNGGFIRKGLIVSFIFLVMALVLINIVAANNTNASSDVLIVSNLDGNVLTIYNPAITPNTTYHLVVQKEETIILEDDRKSDPEGKLVIEDNKLNLPKIQYTVNKDGKEIFNGTLENLNKEASKEPSVRSRRSEPTNLPPTTTTTTTTTTAATTDQVSEEESFWEKYNVIVIIGILFMISFVTVLYLTRSKGDQDDAESKLSNPVQKSLNFYKFKVELIDDSFIKLHDKIVKVFNKKGVPQTLAKSDINGECTLDLPKGTYNIKVEGGEKHEDASQEVNLQEDSKVQLTLTRRQPLQIEVMDDSGNPLKGIKIRVMETQTRVDAGDPAETDAYGIAKFYTSKNKQYIASARSSTGEFISQDKIPINNSETTKRVQLTRRAGTLEIAVTEKATGKTFAGIPVTATKKGTNQITELVTDSTGKINQKLPVGEYIIRLKPGSFTLYNSDEKNTPVTENRTAKIVLDFQFNYQPKTQYLNLINAIREKLDTSYKEVSTYDTCIPLFFKRVGEKPTQLVDKIMKRPVEFLGAKTGPDEIISYTLKTAEFLADEISRIIREKSNVDFYYSIQNLEPVNDLTISDYSQEKFNELVRDTENYHKNHFREIGNKLHEIDTELTQLSGALTIQPVAYLWRAAQKLQENSINEADARKRGVMLFINDKLLDHVREMYNKDEVKARLRFTIV